MKKFVGWIVLALLGLGVALAQGGQQGTQAAADQASVRIAHLVPEGAEVDVVIDGEVVFEGLQAGTVSGYLLVPAGDHEIELVPRGGAAEEAPATDAAQPAAPAQPAPLQPAPAQPGAPAGQPGAAPVAPAAPPEPLATSNLSFEAGSYYTVLATQAGLTVAQQALGGAEPGRAQGQTGGATGGAAVGATGGATGGAAAGPTGGGATSGTGEVQVEMVTDDFGAFPQAGQALVRVIHASPSAPAVSVVAMMTSEQGPEAATLQQGTGGAEAGRAQGQTGGAPPAGQTGGAQPSATGGAAATPGQTGGAAGTGGAAARAQQGPEPIEGQALVSDLAPGNVSDYVAVAGGTYHLQIQTGPDQVAIDLPDTVLEPGVIYTFYAFGNPDETPLSLAVSVDALVARETGNQ